MAYKPLYRSAFDREPRKLDVGLSEVTKRFGLAPPKVLSSVFQDWAATVGPTIAKNVRPRGIRDGVLFLEVNEPAWVTQMQFMHDDVLEKVNQIAGCQAITSLSTKVAFTRTPKRDESGG